MSSAASHYSKKSWPRVKTPGWAAFDFKQRNKQGVELGVDSEPYPPLPNTLSSLRPCENFVNNNHLSARSFSSVLIPSADFPTLTEKGDDENAIQDGGISRKLGDKVVEDNDAMVALKKLKEFYCWADYSLIEEIMVAVDNDVNRASALLNSMGFDNNMETDFVELYSTSKDFHHDSDTLKAGKGTSLGKTTDLAEASCFLQDCLGDQNKEMKFNSIYCEKKPHDGDADMTLILRHLNSITVESEWEEDDIYLSYRKDAIRTMRSASQHSRAASNAFRRGDHLSAQQHSLKAREEWIAAERLNAWAANEILNIRNSKNDMWTLDLHGLHAAEAVQALKAHLWKIETLIPPKRPGSHKGDGTKYGNLRSQSLESFSCIDLGMWDGNKASLRQKPVSLQVITGRGNHSRGQAALPTAVRSFLNENGYCYEEPRQGVVTVRPKFRQF